MPEVRGVKKETLEGARKDALVWVNKFRKATGLKSLKALPKGKRGSTTSCPVALGINHGIEVGGSDLEAKTKRAKAALDKAYEAGLLRPPGPGTWETHWIPKKVAKFIRYFDQGLYPRLFVGKKLG